MSKFTWRKRGIGRASLRTISTWLGLRSAASADTCTGCTTRPRPVCAQMIEAFGCRLSSAFICVRYTGSVSGFANGMSMSLCRITTRPDSAAKSRIRSSAGLVRLAVSPEILDETNSLWMVNSPMPGEHAGKRLQHAADVIGRVHVGRIEPGDHRIEARLLGRASALGRRWRCRRR